jgi:predicted lactoylglutathione lyase
LGGHPAQESQPVYSRRTQRWDGIFSPGDTPDEFHRWCRFTPFPFDVLLEVGVQEISKGEHMAKKIFVNLAVRDLRKSMDFFRKLGFTFNAQFTNETAACMIISEDIYVMLLTEDKFKTFTPKQICNATKSTEVLVCLSSASRDEVNEMVYKAVAAGGTTYKEPEDHGFMYGHGFQDLDGHIWELAFMEPSAPNPA